MLPNSINPRHQSLKFFQVLIHFGLFLRRAVCDHGEGHDCSQESVVCFAPLGCCQRQNCLLLYHSHGGRCRKGFVGKMVLDGDRRVSDRNFPSQCASIAQSVFSRGASTFPGRFFSAALSAAPLAHSEHMKGQKSVCSTLKNLLSHSEHKKSPLLSDHHHHHHG